MRYLSGPATGPDTFLLSVAPASAPFVSSTRVVDVWVDPLRN